VDLSDVVLRPAADGLRLKLRVVPGARRDGVLGAHGDALRVAVRAVAEKGRANEAVMHLLAAALGLAPGSVALVAGFSGRSKIVEVRGLAAEELRTRLERAGRPPG
jgi:uncharacterized protein (TIGR00251 family)